MTAPANAPTKISAGSVRTGQVLRLANRPADFPFGASWVTVQEVNSQADGPRRRAYTVTVEDPRTTKSRPVVYGVFSHATKFELQPTPKPVKATSERSARGLRTSPHMRVAISKLAAAPNGVTREVLKADPMIVKSMETRGWAKVDRSGTERKVDLIELTAEGKEQARSMGFEVR